MADQDQPANDKVQAANEAEMKRWEGDFPEEDLNIPYKREAEEEKPVEEEEEKPKEGKEDGDDETVEQVVVEPVVTVEDPGEFKPGDYSFEIEVDGKTHKIESVDQAEKLAEEQAEKLTAKQIMSLMTKASRMELKQERDKDAWEAKKQKFEEQSATEQERIDRINSLANGFDYLVGKGLLPAVDKKYLDADWTDPEVAKQPGVKEQIDLLNYMSKENAARAKAGIDPITSAVDLYNAYQLDAGHKKEEAERKAAGEQRRAAGSRIAGVSPSQQAPYIPKGIAVGRVLPQRGAAMWDD